VGGRRIDAVVTGELHADFHLAQQRIVERRRMRPVLSRDEDISRPVVGARGESHLEAAGHPHHHVAQAGFQSIAEETAALRPPGVLDGGAEIAREQRGDLVLESLQAAVREGQIVGIGADFQDARRALWAL
jgi:hypothetical protein